MTPKVIATAVPAVAIAAIEPLKWYPLGYTVEAGSLIAGLAACACVRVWFSRIGPTHHWTVDLPVSILTLLFTAGAIAKLRPDPVVALLIGTGLGAVGAGIIKRAQAFADKWLGTETGDTNEGGQSDGRQP